MQNNNNYPLISIITVCFNSAETLRQTMESVLHQTYPNIEYILVDGDSTDNTLDIIKQYASKFIASGIIYRYISEQDHGLYDAMNKGIVMATGEWVGILNSDDYYAANDALEVLQAQILRVDDAMVVYSDLVYISLDDTKVVRYWKSGQYSRRSFYFGWMPPHPTLFVKKIVYSQVGLFKLTLKSAADYEMILRILLKHRIKAIYLEKITIKMRIGGVSNRTLRNRIVANKMDQMAWKINDLKPYWFTLYLKPLRKIWQYIKKPHNN